MLGLIGNSSGQATHLAALISASVSCYFAIQPISFAHYVKTQNIVVDSGGPAFVLNAVAFLPTIAALTIGLFSITGTLLSLWESRFSLKRSFTLYHTAAIILCTPAAFLALALLT